MYKYVQAYRLKRQGTIVKNWTRGKLKILKAKITIDIMLFFIDLLIIWLISCSIMSIANKVDTELAYQNLKFITKVFGVIAFTCIGFSICVYQIWQMQYELKAASIIVLIIAPLIEIFFIRQIYLMILCLYQARKLRKQGYLHNSRFIDQSITQKKFLDDETNFELNKSNEVNETTNHNNPNKFYNHMNDSFYNIQKSFPFDESHVNANDQLSKSIHKLFEDIFLSQNQKYSMMDQINQTEEDNYLKLPIKICNRHLKNYDNYQKLKFFELIQLNLIYQLYGAKAAYKLVKNIKSTQHKDYEFIGNIKQDIVQYADEIIEQERLRELSEQEFKLISELNKDKPNLFSKFISKFDLKKKKLNLDKIDEANSKDEASLPPSQNEYEGSITSRQSLIKLMMSKIMKHQEKKKKKKFQPHATIKNQEQKNYVELLVKRSLAQTQKVQMNSEALSQSDIESQMTLNYMNRKASVHSIQNQPLPMISPAKSMANISKGSFAPSLKSIKQSENKQVISFQSPISQNQKSIKSQVSKSHSIVNQQSQTKKSFANLIEEQQLLSFHPQSNASYREFDQLEFLTDQIQLVTQRRDQVNEDSKRSIRISELDSITDSEERTQRIMQSQMHLEKLLGDQNDNVEISDSSYLSSLQEVSDIQVGQNFEDSEDACDNLNVDFQQQNIEPFPDQNDLIGQRLPTEEDDVRKSKVNFQARSNSIPQMENEIDTKNQLTIMDFRDLIDQHLKSNGGNTNNLSTNVNSQDITQLTTPAAINQKQIVLAESRDDDSYNISDILPSKKIIKQQSFQSLKRESSAAKIYDESVLLRTLDKQNQNNQSVSTQKHLQRSQSQTIDMIQRKSMRKSGSQFIINRQQTTADNTNIYDSSKMIGSVDRKSQEENQEIFDKIIDEQRQSELFLKNKLKMIHQKKKEVEYRMTNFSVHKQPPANRLSIQTPGSINYFHNGNDYGQNNVSGFSEYSQSPKGIKSKNHSYLKGFFDPVQKQTAQTLEKMNRFEKDRFSMYMNDFKEQRKKFKKKQNKRVKNGKTNGNNTSGINNQDLDESPTRDNSIVNEQQQNVGGVQIQVLPTVLPQTSVQLQNQLLIRSSSASGLRLNSNKKQRGNPVQQSFDSGYSNSNYNMSLNINFNPHYQLFERPQQQLAVKPPLQSATKDKKKNKLKVSRSQAQLKPLQQVKKNQLFKSSEGSVDETTKGQKFQLDPELSSIIDELNKDLASYVDLDKQGQQQNQQLQLRQQQDVRVFTFYHSKDKDQTSNYQNTVEDLESQI
ncbi:UNKNOWN [Stylonychia lemnae]|uniref:Transmembrane protein n=1 Tax=Stylonychia lemnae TaxID=5949 RepID=A0A078BAW0_STYLE|nr:UNKNOWN [Stylonychia lemnae]|eukprot:CDW91351.1 UNKNOWN [Stylonychia lemnae]